MSRRESKRLDAYSDGELSGASQGRVVRRLAASPKLRSELAALRAVGDRVRESEAALAAEAPDLWERIALHLPAVDAEMAEERADGARKGAGLLGWLSRPLAAGALAAAALAVLSVLLLRGGATSNVVQWLDTQGKPVMMLQADGDTTIIWMLDAPSDDLAERRGRAIA